MDATKAFAAVWSREPAVAAPPPHPASATAVHDRVLLCSSVLPWRSARTSWPDRADDLAGVMSATLSRLHAGLTGSAAVPADWRVSGRRRVVATRGGSRLSDHDAYVVDCAPDSG